MNNNLIKTLGSWQGLTGLAMFLLPFLSLVTRWGVGLCSFLFLLGALYHFRQCRVALARHWPAVRWVAYAFLFQLLLTGALVALRPEARVRDLEEPLRMLLAMSATALVLVYRPDRRFLWAGVAGGALGGAALVGYQRIVLDFDRPGGLMNAITTGDFLLCMGLVSLAAAVEMRKGWTAALPLLGMAAGFGGAIMTGTRGGWVALVLAALLFLKYAQAMSGKRIRALVLGCCALFALAYLVPATDVRNRVDQGVNDITAYFNGGSAYSNIGIRLELWKAATLLIADAPLLGVDYAVAREKIAARVKDGSLDEVAIAPVHFHSDPLHAMVTGGVPGLLAWLGILAAPLLFFARTLRPDGPASTRHMALALAGMLVALGFFSFGLSEVIFWSTKASMFYALMIFLLMGLCLNAKEQDGK